MKNNQERLHINAKGSPDYARQMAIQVAGWLGIGASILGVVASSLLARPTLRSQRDKNAIEALSLLDKEIDDANKQAAAVDLSRVRRDLRSELMGKVYANRRDVKWGTRLLVLAFLILLLQSIALLNAD